MKPKFELRKWQSKAIEVCGNRDLSLVVATPGAGKTKFAYALASQWIADRKIDGVVCVVPSRALVAGWQSSWAEMGLQLKSDGVEGNPFPKSYHGVVMTYSKMVNMVDTIRTWEMHGKRLLAVFDEVHHCSENSWGSAAESIGRSCAKVLSLTGTPFRSDAQRISFVDYDASGVCVPQFCYGYDVAVRDQVCRPVEFLTDDGVLEFTELGGIRKLRISELPPINWAIADAKRTAFAPDLDHLAGLIRKASDRLEKYRQEDPNAGCLIVCRPGAVGNEDRHVHAVRDLVEKLTGEKSVVVTHDEDGAHDAIEKFRKSTDKFLISIRMVSEGIDIPRLRVLCLADAMQSKMLFHQIVGRVVRVEPRCEHHTATVVMSKFPHLVEWAGEMDTAKWAGLKEREEATRQMKEKEEKQQKPLSVPIAATHEHGGAISFGEGFTAEEIMEAEEAIESDDALRGVTSVQYAKILRRSGGSRPVAVLEPARNHEQEMAKRRQSLGRLVVRCAKLLGQEPQQVYRSLYSLIGVRNMDDLCDNHPMSLIDQAIKVVATWEQRGQ